MRPDRFPIEKGRLLDIGRPGQGVTPGADPRALRPGLEDQENVGVGRADESEQHTIQKARLGIAIPVQRLGQEPLLDPAWLRSLQADREPPRNGPGLGESLRRRTGRRRAPGTARGWNSPGGRDDQRMPSPNSTSMVFGDKAVTLKFQNL